MALASGGCGREDLLGPGNTLLHQSLIRNSTESSTKNITAPVSEDSTVSSWLDREATGETAWPISNRVKTQPCDKSTDQTKYFVDG
jgi:hypothetical protein